MKALTKEDPGWDELSYRVLTHLNFRKGIIVKDHETINSDCDGSFRVTTNILQSMFPVIDVATTLDYIRKEGMYCDCELCAFSEREPCECCERKEVV